MLRIILKLYPMRLTMPNDILLNGASQRKNHSRNNAGNHKNKIYTASNGNNYLTYW